MPTLISVSQAFGTESVTVPSDATGVALLWALDMGPNGSTLTSVTLGGASSFTILQNVPTVAASFERNGGCAFATITTTGSQTFTPTPSAAATQGPTYYLCWVKDLNAGDEVRASAGDNTESTNALSINCASSASDLVLAIEAGFSGSVPATASGWTAQSSVAYNSQGSKVSSCDSPGASTTTFDAQSESWSVAAMISIKATGGGGGVARITMPPMIPGGWGRR